MLDDVGVLLVLVVRAVRLDDAVDAVDGAGDAVCCDELGEVAVKQAGISNCGTDKLSMIPRGAEKDGREGKRERETTYRSKKSTEMPKSFAILPRPTTL